MIILTAMETNGDAQVGSGAVRPLAEAPVVGQSHLHGLTNSIADNHSLMTKWHSLKVFNEVIIIAMAEADGQSPIGRQAASWS